jgi:hypothetical protein
MSKETKRVHRQTPTPIECFRIGMCGDLIVAARGWYYIVALDMPHACENLFIVLLLHYYCSVVLIMLSWYDHCM